VVLVIYFITSSITAFITAIGIAGIIVGLHAMFRVPDRALLEEEEEVPAPVASVSTFADPSDTDNPLSSTSTANFRAHRFSCPICLSSHPKNGVLIPCGHALCLGCAHSMRESTGACPMCRTRVKGVTELFL
jgi:hypothetical protein